MVPQVPEDDCSRLRLPGGYGWDPSLMIRSAGAGKPSLATMLPPNVPGRKYRMQVPGQG